MLLNTLSPCLHTGDIRMTTYEWHTGDIRVHTDDIE